MRRWLFQQLLRKLSFSFVRTFCRDVEGFFELGFQRCDFGVTGFFAKVEGAFELGFHRCHFGVNSRAGRREHSLLPGQIGLIEANHVLARRGIATPVGGHRSVARSAAEHGGRAGRGPPAAERVAVAVDDLRTRARPA